MGDKNLTTTGIINGKYSSGSYAGLTGDYNLLDADGNLTPIHIEGGIVCLR